VYISFKNVFWRYNNARKFSLEGISLNLKKGDALLVTGFTGSGKSTLLRCINGIIPHLIKGEFHGELSILGNSMAETDPSKLASIVGFAFQNPESQIFAFTVEEEILCSMQKKQNKIRVTEYLKKFNLFEKKDQNPRLLSGGELKVLSILSATINSPKILVLDEPFAYLDPINTQVVKDLIHQSHPDILVIAEHRIENVVDLVNKILLLESGRVLFKGDINKFRKSSYLNYFPNAKLMFQYDRIKKYYYPVG
jgi:energy-coupling factor transport system ATP-binding protein